MDAWTIAIVIGAAIILGLALYAGKLLAQVSQQKRRQAEQRDALIASRNAKMIDSIQLIAKAMQEEQCELSEGALRNCKLLDSLLAEEPADYRQQYPALYALYDKLRDHPTHDAYKALKRQERMKLDVKRARWEVELKEAILKECEQLKQFSL